MGGHNDREAKANMLTRRLDEVAVAAGCDVPASVLASLVRLFGEALEAQLTSRDGRMWSGRDHEFTRCGAVDHTTAGTKPRCVRKLGHAGEHFAVTGEQWGDDNPAEPDHAPERLELLCFCGACDAVATLGRFCARHAGPCGVAEGTKSHPPAHAET